MQPSFGDVVTAKTLCVLLQGLPNDKLEIAHQRVPRSDNPKGESAIYQSMYSRNEPVAGVYNAAIQKHDQWA